uniref:Prohibitin n=1 Tax=Prymnesium polylepis TaxID=72548 RepID=A0A7S4M1Y2_9EUKA|mmetsp:Transcript_11249/g.28079  ORF Transcript_11249/g.28079 Transcript_11249/m.28079 type:complete len:120 (+) Transcript_11249:619-978(+)
MVSVLGPRGIEIEDVLLKAVTLPTQLKHSIELKAQAEQESARMQFVLSKERQEAERKAIEARGIAEFQRIVSNGISPQLLQWKGIEATEKLSESANSKVVIMGNTKASLPVLLSADTKA